METIMVLVIVVVLWGSLIAIELFFIMSVLARLYDQAEKRL